MKKVLNSRFYYNKFQYFVKSLKYSDTDNKWLKSFEFDEVQKLIRDFHEKYFDKSIKGKSNRKRIKTWFYWVFLIKSRHIYITLIITFEVQTRDQIESEQMKFNLNKKKKTKTQFELSYYSHCYHSWMISKHHFLLSFFHQRFSLAFVCDSKSQSFWSFWSSLFEESSIFYFFFFLFVFSFVAISLFASVFVFVTSTKSNVSSWSNR